MLFPLIYMMLIYIFLLFSIIVISYILFSIMCLISGRFYLLGWPQPLGFLQPSPNLLCSIAIARVSVLLSIWMTSWSLFALSGQVRGHICFCAPCWSVLVYISHFPSLTFTSLRPFVSLPPDKLADIQQLAFSLLQTPHVTVCRVMSFLGKANFCTNGHSKLQYLCCVIQTDMLHVYHCPTQLFSCVHFFRSSLCQLEWLAHLQQSPVPLQFPLPDVLIATDANPLIWPFIFRDLGYLYW